jgi:hypothetical protein
MVEKISGAYISQTKNWTVTQIAKLEQSFIERKKSIGRRMHHKGVVCSGQPAQVLLFVQWATYKV